MSSVAPVGGSARDRANQQRYRDGRGGYFYCYDNRQDGCYWDDERRR